MLKKIEPDLTTERRAGKSGKVTERRTAEPDLITEGWLPGLNERPWRPTIVGAASLVSQT